MNSIALIAFTQRGCELARRLADGLGARDGYAGAQVSVSGPARMACALGVEPYGSLGTWTAEHFGADDALVYVGATGIAVRAIAAHVRNKFIDPAVVSVDETGAFAVPLLSGHVGGANELARTIAQLSGGQAVVSTATDVNRVFAVDEWAARNGMHICERVLAKEISARLLEGGHVGYWTDCWPTWELPRGILRLAPLAQDDISGKPPRSARDGMPGKPPASARDGMPGKPPASAQDGISGRPPRSAQDGISGRPPRSAQDGISGRPPRSAPCHPERRPEAGVEGSPAADSDSDAITPFDLGFAVSLGDTCAPFERTLHLVPRVVTVGVGCRKGADAQVLAAHVDEALAAAGVSPHAVARLASIDVKCDEPAILQLAAERGWELAFYSAEELAAVPGDFEASEFVKQTVGVDNVCERAALAGGGTLLSGKHAKDGTTVALGARFPR